jgi:hypothetical protein
MENQDQGHPQGNFPVDNSDNSQDQQEDEDDPIFESDEEDEEKKLRSKVKALAHKIQVDKLFFPTWGSSGGSKREVILDIEKPDSERKYVWVKRSEIDL